MSKMTRILTTLAGLAALALSDGIAAAQTMGIATMQPALREFSAAALYKNYNITYHPGALKYFKEHNIAAKSLQ
jgi:TRAP-type uncharacterized transport system substrate-binding protein